MPNPILLTERQVAALLGISHRTLQKARVTGLGVAIPFVKLGNCVRYDEREVSSYVERCRRTSTSDTGRVAS
jgi:hypothetical protein